MAAPSIGTGISQLDDSDNNSWSSGTVGHADGSIDSDDLSVVNVAGIDPDNTTQVFENANGPSTTSGNHYSAYSPSWTSVDISSANSALILHFAGNPGQFNRVSGDSDGIVIYAFDTASGSTTNYLQWDIGGASDTFFAGAASFFPLVLRYADATENGTVDETAIVSVGVAWKAADTGNFGVDFRINQIIHVDGEVALEDGDGTTVATFEEYYDLLYPNSNQTYHSLLNFEVEPAWGFGHPVRLNPENFNDSNFTFIFLPDNDSAGFNVPTTGYYSLTVDPDSATADVIMSDGTFAYASGTYDLTIDGGTADTMDFTRIAFLNTEDVTISGSATMMDGCTFPSPNSVDISDGDLTISVDDCAGPVVVSGDLTAGSTVTITNPQADALQFDLDVGNYSDLNFTVPASSVVNVDPATADGTYNLSGLRSVSGSIEFDNLSANDTTITLVSAQSATVASPTSGGGSITIDNATSVDVTVTVTDQSDSTPIQNARVRLTAASGGPETVGTVILEGLTNASGVLTTSYTFTGNQPVTGTVRQGTTSPYFKPGTLGGTITSSGYDVPLSLVRD